MDVRQLETMDEFEDCREIQRKAWNFSDDDVLPFHLIRAFCDAAEPYGIILGSFADNKMTGFCAGFPVLKEKEILMHMIAVLPDCQHKGIGKALMDCLVESCRKHGYKKIVWTFDPLESANAVLYFRKMGAICRKYVQDYYIFQESNLSDVPADRFKAELFVADHEANLILAECDEEYRIEIPGNFQQIKKANRNHAANIRMATRKEFDAYINVDKFIVVDYQYDRNRNTGMYVLKRGR